MQTYLLKQTQFVPRSQEEVFEFFKAPENLARLTPASLGFKILTPAPVKMEKNRLIDYTIKVFGISQRWTTLITEYDPPRHFVDEQLKGPYSFWHHSHIFEPCEGGTNIIDEVRYAMPFGLLGKLAHLLFVKRQLDGIFEYRRRMIEKLWPNSR